MNFKYSQCLVKWSSGSLYAISLETTDKFLLQPFSWLLVSSDLSSFWPFVPDASFKYNLGNGLHSHAIAVNALILAGSLN